MSEVLGTLASIKALMEVVAECSKFLSGTILSSPKEAKLGNELRTLEKVLDELLMNVDRGIGTYLSSKTLDIVRNYTEACIKDIKKFQKKMSMRSEEKGFKAFLSCLQRQQKEKKTQEFISTIERRKSTLILFLVVNQMGTAHAVPSNQSQPDPANHTHVRSTPTELNDVVGDICSTPETYECTPRAVIDTRVNTCSNYKSGESRVKDQVKISTLDLTDTHHCPDKKPLEYSVLLKALSNLIPAVIYGSKLQEKYQVYRSIFLRSGDKLIFLCLWCSL